MTYTEGQNLKNLYFQASGVKVSEDVKQMYDEIKKKKNHRYLVFYIKDEKTIAVEKIGEYLSGSSRLFE